MHEDNTRLYTAISVAIASPNVVSFPLMVMDTLCKQSEQIQQDFDDAESCFVEMTSMIFVYSIGWQAVFWGYGFPILQTLVKGNKANGDAADDDITSGDPDIVVDESEHRSSCNTYIHKIGSNLWLLLSRLASSGVMQATAVGIIIGISSPIQNALFFDFTGLTPFGATLETLSDPVICINCLIMSSSLASVTVFPKPPKDEKTGQIDWSKLTYTSRFVYELKRVWTRMAKWSVSSKSFKNGKSDSADSNSIEMTQYKAAQGAEDVDIAVTHSGTSCVSVSTNHDDDDDDDDKSLTLHSSVYAAYSAEGISISSEDCELYGNTMPNTHRIAARVGRMRSYTEPNMKEFVQTELGDGFDSKHFVDPFRYSQNINHKSDAIISTVANKPTTNESKNSLSSNKRENIKQITSALSMPPRSTLAASKEDNKEIEQKTAYIPPPQTRTVVAMVLCRLIISPLIILPIAHLCMKYNFVSKEDRSFLLIIVLESAAPSAQLMIVSLSQLGIVREASQLAYCYIFQYALSIITVTIVTIAAIISLYD
jgi:hypothetical protein